jgi:diaminopimelate epimerase
MEFEFVKSHGLGNDYLVIDPARTSVPLTPRNIRLICDRNRGVGSDGILAVTASHGGDFGVRIYNPDGTEAEKSGNGLRIFAKYLYDHGYTRLERFTIDTPGGRVTAALTLDAGRVTRVCVDMGRAVINRSLTHLDVAGARLDVTALSVGNPHCVTFVPDLGAIDVFRLGPLIEKHPAFPQKTNVQFAQVLDRSHVKALIWERGAGHTLASGSSSCAVVAACLDRGLVDREVSVQMEGGDLQIHVGEDGEIEMEGPVEEICHGCFSPELYARLLAGAG